MCQRTLFACLTALLLVAGGITCKKSSKDQSQSSDLESASAGAGTYQESTGDNPAGQAGQAGQAIQFFAGRHILIAYAGARRARPNVTRTKEQALAEAKRLAGEARKDPAKFAELAKKHSDGPSGPRGGSLGKWPKGRMVPAFQVAVEKLKIGGISEPVETPFGYHIIKREDPQSMP